MQDGSARDVLRGGLASHIRLFVSANAPLLPETPIQFREQMSRGEQGGVLAISAIVASTPDNFDKKQLLEALRLMVLRFRQTKLLTVIDALLRNT